MDKPIGKEGVLKIEVLNGKVRVSAGYDGKGADAGFFVELEGDYFIDKLAAAVPGESALEAVIVATLKSALKGVKV